jgi:endonuclease-8
MPEGDTVWRTARRLHAALAGQPLNQADLRWPSLATARLTGDITIEVVSRGKHILQRLASARTLHSHLRMEGSWRIESTPEVTARQLANPDLRVVLGTSRWTALGLRLGMLDLVPTRREGELVDHLGPDLLGPDWAADRAVSNLEGSGALVGAALLDQRNLAGLGTLWVSEVLFLEHVNPWRPCTELGESQVAAIVDRAHRLLDAARQAHVQTTTGIRRKGENTYAYGRSGRPCRRCGATIRVAQIGSDLRERAVFYCPECQGGLAPGDDGRAQQPFGSSSSGRSGRSARRPL